MQTINEVRAEYINLWAKASDKVKTPERTATYNRLINETI